VERWDIAMSGREYFFLVPTEVGMVALPDGTRFATSFEHKDYEIFAEEAWEGLPDGMKEHPGHYATDPRTACKLDARGVTPFMYWTEWMFRNLHRAGQLKTCTMDDGSILSWYPGNACQASLKALALVPEFTPGQVRLPKPLLTIEHGKVFLKGQHVILDMGPESHGACLHLLSVLIEAAGDWRPSKTIGDGIYAGTRWDRVIKRMPPCLRDLIESESGKGSRLGSAAWNK
jgi:hypothetical protein